MAAMIRRWSSSELSIAGERIEVVDYRDGCENAAAPIERMLRSFLRTRSGASLRVEDWSPVEKKLALQAIVASESRLGGIAVMDPRFLAELRAAASEEALDDLALRFMNRWHAANHLSYMHLRASASATVL